MIMETPDIEQDDACVEIQRWQEESPKQRQMKAQVWRLLAEAGFEEKASDSLIKRILEELLNKTLETEEQLAALLGLEIPVQNSGLTDNEKEIYIEVISSEDEDVDVSCDTETQEVQAENVLNKLDKVPKNFYTEVDTQDRNQPENPVSRSEEATPKDTGLENDERISPEESLLNFQEHEQDQEMPKATKTRKGKRKQSECLECGEKFSLLSKLKEHMKTIHSQGKRSHHHRCSVCGRYYKLASLLEKHQKFIINGETFKCEFCDQGFCNRLLLDKHIWSRAELKAFECLVCRKLFCSKSLLSAHQKTSCPCLSDESNNDKVGGVPDPS